MSVTIEHPNARAGTDRRDRVVTACLRAAVAWSRQRDSPQALAELSRMVGVVMYALGPGKGPVTPSELLDALARPLEELLDLCGEAGDQVLDGLVLLDEAGSLNDAALGSGCEFVDEVFHHATAPEWMPRWAWMRAEQIEQDTFRRLVSGSEEQYRTARRFLIDHPAGEETALVEEANERQAQRVARFRPLTASQRYPAADGGEWWWPCPVCRWPMRVTRTQCRCVYGHHRAVYDIATERRAPRLQSRVGVPRPPVARRVTAGTVCVDESVWRYITVPGRTEVDLADKLRERGAGVTEWPNHDLYDLGVEIPGGRRIRVEVKEYASVDRLIARLRANPPRADVLVIPDSHGQQRGTLRQALPNLEVLLADDLVRRVRQLMKKAT